MVGIVRLMVNIVGDMGHARVLLVFQQKETRPELYSRGRVSYIYYTNSVFRIQVGLYVL